MLIKKILVSMICALGIAATSAQAGVTYTSTPSGSAASPFGVPDTTTYGQVFTVPTDGNTRLDSFSFFISGSLLKAYGGVAAWTGTGAGPALFASSPFKANYNSATEVTVDTGGLNLLAGQQYIAYFSTAGIAGNSGWDSMEFGSVSGAASSVFEGIAWDNGEGASPNHDDWFGGQNEDWITFAGSLSFSAPPSNVPEPASLALLGVGMAGLAGVRRRKPA
jgi:hypothetical protein